MTTTVRAMSDALLAIRDREQRISAVPAKEVTLQHREASSVCDAQAMALKNAIMREPPQHLADLRPMLIAAAEELETLLSIEIEGVTGEVEAALTSILITLEHTVIHPALGPVAAQDEGWNMALYRKRAAGRLIDPSQVQASEHVA